MHSFNADAQADLSPRWAHISEDTYSMRIRFLRLVILIVKHFKLCYIIFARGNCRAPHKSSHALPEQMNHYSTENFQQDMHTLTSTGILPVHILLAYQIYISKSNFYRFLNFLT